jgi:thiamine kinase-like enzyme
VDWNDLAQGLPGRFHGDFHFENILRSDYGREFTFLDWRQDFAGSLIVGDIYYDMAKLLHGMIINHELIARGLFHIDWVDNSIRYDFHRKQMLVECEAHFAAWLTRQGYSREKVYLLTALIFLNIAALHHEPYCHLLYALGKSKLHQSQQNHDSESSP